MSTSEDGQNWTQKYRPQSTSDVQGNNKDIKQLEEWISTYSKHDKPQLLVGSPGTGKTSTVKALANDFDLPLMEINASDARKTDDIAEIAERASVRPYSADKQIVLLDEIDSMSGRSNLKPLYDLLDSSPNPIVCVANDKYEIPDGIKRRCNTRTFKLSSRSIKARLKDVVAAEGIDIGAATLNKIADRENLRDAIHDLQAIAEGRDLLEDQREYEGSLFNQVERVVKAKPTSFDESPPKILHWIDKNIRDRYRLVEASVAWDALSRADKWLMRANRGDYRWWKYAAEMERQVPHLRLSEAWDGYISIESPDIYGKGWTADEEQLYEELDDAGELIGYNFTEFREVVLPLLQDELDEQDVFELGVAHGLSTDAVSVFNVSESSYEEYRRTELETPSDGRDSSESFMDV